MLEILYSLWLKHIYITYVNCKPDLGRGESAKYNYYKVVKFKNHYIFIS